MGSSDALAILQGNVGPARDAEPAAGLADTHPPPLTITITTEHHGEHRHLATSPPRHRALAMDKVDATQGSPADCGDGEVSGLRRVGTSG